MRGSQVFELFERYVLPPKGAIVLWFEAASMLRPCQCQPHCCILWPGSTKEGLMMMIDGFSDGRTAICKLKAPLVVGRVGCTR